MGYICFVVEQVIVGNIEDLFDLDFIFDGGELIYFFVGMVVNVNEFYWDFGDLIILVELNFMYVYNGFGIYFVCLIVMNNCNFI